MSGLFHFTPPQASHTPKGSATFATLATKQIAPISQIETVAKVASVARGNPNICNALPAYDVHGQEEKPTIDSLIESYIEAIQKLNLMICPSYIEQTEWHLFLESIVRFSINYGYKAAREGCTAQTLFDIPTNNNAVGGLLWEAYLHKSEIRAINTHQAKLANGKLLIISQIPI